LSKGGSSARQSVFRYIVAGLIREQHLPDCTGEVAGVQRNIEKLKPGVIDLCYALEPELTVPVYYVLACARVLLLLGQM
jgi:hypothetical protein